MITKSLKFFPKNILKFSKYQFCKYIIEQEEKVVDL